MLRFVIILLCLMPMAAWADMYKCPDAKGRTVLQDKPCGGEKASLPPDRPEVAPPQPEPSTLPADYRQQIDATFDRILFDPESRRVEYLDIPLSNAVCGMINARNRMGGYVGRQPFLAMFDAGCKLQGLKTYKDDELILMKYGSGKKQGYYSNAEFSNEWNIAPVWPPPSLLRLR